MSHYTRHGKQILLDGKHMADAVDDTAAMMILNALRAMDERCDCDDVPLAPHVPGFHEQVWPGELGEAAAGLLTPLAWGTGERARPLPDLTVRVDGLRHVHMRQGDEMSCSCGLRWSVGEDDPH